MPVCVGVCVSVYVCAHICVCVHVCIVHVRICVSSCMHSCMCTRACACVLVYVFVGCRSTYPDSSLPARPLLFLPYLECGFSLSHLWCFLLQIYHCLPIGKRTLVQATSPPHGVQSVPGGRLSCPLGCPGLLSQIFLLFSDVREGLCFAWGMRNWPHGPRGSGMTLITPFFPAGSVTGHQGPPPLFVPFALPVQASDLVRSFFFSKPTNQVGGISNFLFPSVPDTIRFDRNSEFGYFS